MLKRALSLLLSIVMLLSCVPLQAFATEVTEDPAQAIVLEETEAPAEALPQETVPEAGETEAIEPEVTEPEVTETEATETEVTEPETVETEATEPKVTEPETVETEATEPEVTEPEVTEETEPEVTEEAEEEEPEEEVRVIPNLPAVRVQHRKKTVTWEEDVRKVTVDENGIAVYEDVTETHSFTYKYPEIVNIRPVGAKSIGEGDWGNYTFTTFEDLQQLCTIGDQGYTDIQYIGDGPLVISGDVTIPAYTTLISWDEPIVINKGATLEVEEYGFLNCDTLTVNGSYVSHSWNDHVESALTVNGSMTLYNSLYLGMDATVSGFSRIELVNEYSFLSKSATFRSFADFKSALTKAQKDTSGVRWELHYYSEDVPEVVIEESITVPEGVTVTLGWYDVCDVVIPEGVTLEINDSYYGSSFYGDAIVHGELVNNSSWLYVEDTITFSETGSYTGDGWMYHHSENPQEQLSDWLIGLDTSELEVQETRYEGDTWVYWNIRNLSHLPRMGTPKNLMWNKEYTWVESGGSWKQKLVDRMGAVTWTPVKPLPERYKISYYRDGEFWAAFDTWFGAEAGVPYVSNNMFVGTDPESGTYYFTVQALGDGQKYRGSEIATSGEWEYVKPKKSLGTCTDLYWDGLVMEWTTPDGEYLPCEMEIYYAATAEEEPFLTSGAWGMSTADNMELWEDIIQWHGEGYYYFRVRALSDDITKVCNGPWSELSPAFHLDHTVDDVKDQLGDIPTKADDQVIRDSVQSIGMEDLLTSMENEDVLTQLQKLEKAVGGAAPVEVTDAVPQLDAGKISILGASLNTPVDASQPISLVLDAPKLNKDLIDVYDSDVAVSFSMTLENVADADDLDVPVKVTLPVPGNIHLEQLVIIQFKDNGWVNEYKLEDLELSQKDGTTYVSLLLTGFSDFVMTNFADNAVDSGVTGQVEWKVTSWGKLVLSGEGWTDSYYEGNPVPWASYADQITEVVIKPGVTELGYQLFSGLNHVTEITVPEGVEHINYYAFWECDALETVYLPASADLGGPIFSGCDKLKNIYIAEGNPYIFDDAGVGMSYLYNGDALLFQYPIGRPDAAYQVADGTVYISQEAFKDAVNLKEVELPDSLEHIQGWAFQNSGLESVTIPSSVTSMGYGAFSDCTDLQTIYFQGNAPYIAEDAFTGVEADAYYPADNDTWTDYMFQNYGGQLNWVKSDYIEITGEDMVEGGKSVKLTAQIMPVHDKNAKITWTIAEEDKEYATLKVSGNTATLTAVDVSEPQTVTVTATAGGDIAPCQYVITVQPKAKSVQLYFWYADEETGEEYWYSLDSDNQWAWVLEEGDEDGYEMARMMAEVQPWGANSQVTWTSSDESIATIDETGVAMGTGKTGSVTFTATAANGVKASYTWKVIDLDVDGEPVGETVIDMMGGQSRTFKVNDAKATKPKALSSKNVYWYLWMPQGDVSAFASINQSGKLTTKKVQEAVTFWVCADIHKDNYLSDYVEYQVTLYPATTHVELYNEDICVTGKTVNYDVELDMPMSFSAQVLPDDAMPVDVKCEIGKAKWVEDPQTGSLTVKDKYATYTIDPETKILTVSDATGKTGTVAIKVTAQDGSKKTATVKIKFGVMAEEVEVTNTETELKSGKSMTLKTKVTPANVSTKGVTWALADPADKAYVKLSGSKITAQTVYEEHDVTLIATSKDGNAQVEYTVTVKPADPKALVIFDADTEWNVTKSTIYSDLSEQDRYITLVAKNLEDGTDADVKWSVKGKNVEYSVEDGELTLYMQKAGSVTVTAKEGKRSATVTIKAAYMGRSVEVTTKNGKNVIENEDGDKWTEVASGKTLDLKATVKDNEGRTVTGNKVTWSVVEGSAATVNASGKVTAAKNLTSAQEVLVRATAADGSGVYGEISVYVKPLATGISIYTLEEDVQMRTLDAYSNSWKNTRSNTNLTWDMAAVDENGELNDSFQIYSTVYPFYENDEARSAIQGVKWKSSTPKVATVSTDGEVTCLKAGTTTITATAADGSNQKISFKLTVVKRAQQITLNDTEVVGGKSVSLKAAFEPADTTNKKLYWGIYGDTAFAKIDQKGKLTTKKVTAPKTVWVYASTQDGSQIYCECAVTIWPKAVTEVKLFHEGEKLGSKDVIELRVGESIRLTNDNAPFGKASQAVTWKSSDAASVSVEDGVVTGHKAGKTVTITATAADGSKKSATVTIKTQEKQVQEKTGSVYYLNSKPEFFDALCELSSAYTDQTGVSVTILSPAYGTYGDALNQHIDEVTVFNLFNEEDMLNWDAHTLDLANTSLARELYTNEFNLYNPAGKMKAIGYCYESYGLIVNTELLAEYGYTVEDIHCFEDLKAVSEAINADAEATGVYAFADAGLDPSSEWRFSGHLANMPLFYEFRDRGITEQPAEITGAYLDNYKQIWDLYINNAAADPSELKSIGGDQARTQFAEGNAVFYQNGTWEYELLISMGMTDSQLEMIPIYCGVDGEEKAGLCSGTENHWAINSQAAPEDIEASIDFLTWMVSNPKAAQIFVNHMGAVPFKNCPESGNKFNADGKELLEKGNYAVTWAFNYTPNVGSWRTNVVTALSAYSAGYGSWEVVESAFVDGWAFEYEIMHG